MRSELKQKKQAAALLEYLKSNGHKFTEEQETELIEGAQFTPREHNDFSVLQAEGVLHILNSTRGMISKKCQECNEVFMSSYQAVGYCSNLCRGKAMERKTGMRWNYSVDRYAALDVEKPLVVSPAVHKVLLELAHRLIQDHNILVQEPEVSETSPEYPEELPTSQASDSTTPVESPPPLEGLSFGASLPSFDPPPSFLPTLPAHHTV